MLPPPSFSTVPVNRIAARRFVIVIFCLDPVYRRASAKTFPARAVILFLAGIGVLRAVQTIHTRPVDSTVHRERAGFAAYRRSSHGYPVIARGILVRANPFTRPDKPYCLVLPPGFAARR